MSSQFGKLLPGNRFWSIFISRLIVPYIPKDRLKN